LRVTDRGVVEGRRYFRGKPIPSIVGLKYTKNNE